MLDKYIKGIVKFVNDVVARDGGIPILNPNGHTELTVGRPCSGKHVIEVSVIRKAT